MLVNDLAVILLLLSLQSAVYCAVINEQLLVTASRDFVHVSPELFEILF